jgi:translation initiation factor eIF-2B subunit gamma
VPDITLVTPPKARKATQAVLDLNPHFTALPRVEICSPGDLNENTGTAEIFRLKEVQDIITGDFVVLPCDLICELDGLSLLQEWMVAEGGLGAATGGLSSHGRNIFLSVGGEKRGRRGGLSVWYETKVENNIKKEETDFLASTPLPKPKVRPPQDSIRNDISQIALTMPTDTLKDIQEENEGNFALRHSLLKKFGRLKLHTTTRDAHIYLFPYWVLQMMKRNEAFDSLSEDVLGWWAKAGWQEGLGDKLGLREVLGPATHDTIDLSNGDLNPLLDEVDLSAYITTTTIPRPELDTVKTVSLASRVRDPSAPSETVGALVEEKAKLTVPPILAYIQPSSATAPLIRRVDTEEQLLNISLRLARLPALDDKTVTSHSPYAADSKIHNQITIPKQSHIDTATSLIAPNTTLSERVAIKESVIGTNCSIGTGAKLTRCLLMDGVVIGDFVSLIGCIIGPRAKITGGPKEDRNKTDLKNVKVTGGTAVEWGTVAEGRVLGGGDLLDEGEMEGMSDGEEFQGRDDDDDNDDEDDESERS